MKSIMMIKRTKTTVVLLALVATALLSIEYRGAVGAQEPANKLEIIGVSVPFNERAGADDGALFAVHFGGDNHGSLDTCG